MKQKNFIRLLFCILLSSYSLIVHSEDLEFLYTSTTLYNGGPGLTGGTAYTMPAGTNSYVGWIWFPYGFTINSGASSGLNVIPSIEGTINLNDGTLTMTGDVVLASNGQIIGNGNIDGQSHALFLSDELSLNSTLTFISDTIIDGNNNPLTLGSNAQLWVTNNTTVTLQNMIINDLDSITNKIVMEGTESELVLDNVTIWLDGDYSFSQGSFFVHNDVTIAGSSHTFSYQSLQTSHITKQSELTIEHGVRFSYIPSSRTNLVMADDTSHLLLDGCILHADATGLELTKGTIIFDALVTLSADGQTIGTALTLGTASSDLTAIFLPGANIQAFGYIDAN